MNDALPSLLTEAEVQLCERLAEVEVANAATPHWWAANLNPDAGWLPGSDSANPLSTTARLVAWCRTVAHVLRCAVYKGYRIYFLCPPALRRRLRRRLATEGHGCEIIRTWVDGRTWESPGAPYQDTYWHDFVDNVAERCDNLVILAEAEGDEKHVAECFRHANDGSPICVPYEFFLTPWTILKAAWLAVFASCRVPAGLSVGKRDVTGHIRRQIRSPRNGGERFSNYCQYFSAVQIFRRLQPARFWYLWENAVWEKMNLLARCQHSPTTRMVGYQHASMILSLLRYYPGTAAEEHALHPDRIVTTGQMPIHILEQFGHYPDGLFSVGGSLRYRHLFDKGSPEVPNGTPNTIGIAGNIDAGTTAAMLASIESVFELDPNVSVVVKFHPNCGYEEIRGHLPKFNWDRTRVVTELADFWEAVDILCYAESTICFEAAMLGLPIVCLDTGQGRKADNMFYSENYKWIIDRGAAILEVMRVVGTMSKAERRSQIDAAREAVKAYFTPPETATMAGFY